MPEEEELEELVEDFDPLPNPYTDDTVQEDFEDADESTNNE